MEWHLPRGIYNIGLMVAVAADYGLTAEQCLEGSGIAASALHNPSSTILPQQELTVVENLMRLLPTVPDLALQIGRRFHMSVYGTMAFAMSSCATLGEGIALGMRYKELTLTLADKQVLAIEDDLTAMIFGDESIPQHLRAFIVERDISAMVNTLRELFGDNPIRRISFRFPRPEYADQFNAYFGIEPVYSAPRNYFAIETAALSLPMPQADPHARQLWEAEVQMLIAQRLAKVGVAGKVRDLLIRNIEQTLDMEEVAARLGVSSRTLRRLLIAEHTSFRQLLDGVRETLAERLLSAAHISIEEIASRLGFTDASGFTLAFKRWKGMPPRDWRNRHKTS